MNLRIRTFSMERKNQRTMKKVFMIIAAMCMTSIMASAQKTIRVSTDKTDLVMQVSPTLYQVYLGDKLKNPSDYNHLKWDVYAASDGSVCQRGHEVYATSGAEDFFEPAVAVTHADGNMTTYLYYQSSEEKRLSVEVLRPSSRLRTRCIR